MRRREEETRKGGMPVARRRGMVEGQSLVWRVVRTRWPVRAARMPIWAVSRSRVSPTRMTSGSWRRKERRAAAKVRPISSLIWTWLTPLRLYSTGSSAVMMLVSGGLTGWAGEEGGVGLPGAVGAGVVAMPEGGRVGLWEYWR